MIQNKNEIGLGPDEIIFRGEQKIDQVLMRILDFDSNKLVEQTAISTKDFSSYQQTDTITWINIDGLHNTAVMKEVTNAFNLDSMVMSEVLNTKARPRIIEYDNCTLISINMMRREENSEHTIVENLSLILTDKVLISFQERRGDVFEPIRERIRKQKKRIRNGGIDYLTFALLDIVVDNYLYVLSQLGEKIEALEDNLLTNPSQKTVNQINKNKRELNFLRKSIKPAKEMILTLVKMDFDYFTDKTDIHFKELEDNIRQANDASDHYREILSDQINIYHTTISSKLNDVMKFLTVFSVVFIPLTFIAGIYGTNFDNIPELKYKYSYFIMWGVMIFVAIAMLFYFRKKKWL